MIRIRISMDGAVVREVEGEYEGRLIFKELARRNLGRLMKAEKVNDAGVVTLLIEKRFE